MQTARLPLLNRYVLGLNIMVRDYRVPRLNDIGSLPPQTMRNEGERFFQARVSCLARLE